jgi:hypothetical protein
MSCASAFGGLLRDSPTGCCLRGRNALSTDYFCIFICFFIYYYNLKSVDSAFRPPQATASGRIAQEPAKGARAGHHHSDIVAAESWMPSMTMTLSPPHCELDKINHIQQETLANLPCGQANLSL